jgi:L-iditol 2-dehydrogenase
MQQAVMVEPTANVVTDLLERTRVETGDFVVVQGPGPIGLLAAMAARAVGAKDVAIIGTPGDIELRFKKAKELGFDKLINIGESDPVKAVLEWTDGLGADVVVECSGSPKAIPLTADMVKKMGRICCIGLTGKKKVELDWDKFAFKVATVVFNLSTFYTSWEKTIELISSGRIQAEKVVTCEETIDNWEKAFNAVENLEALKAVIVPD